MILTDIINCIKQNPKDLSVKSRFNDSKLVVFDFRNSSFAFQEHNPESFQVTIKCPKGDVSFSTDQADTKLTDFVLLKNILS